MLSFHLISASLKQLSLDITNDIIVKQNIWRHVIFVKLRISIYIEGNHEWNWRNIFT